MKTYDNIPEELNSLKCYQVASIFNKQIPFFLPTNYFDTLANEMVSGVMASNSSVDKISIDKISTEYYLPENYFESFADTMLEIVANVEATIQNKSLPSISLPYALPNNYFDNTTKSIEALMHGQLSIEEEWQYLTNGLIKENTLPFQTPDGYFDKLPQLVLDNIYEALYPEPDLSNSILGELRNINPFDQEVSSIKIDKVITKNNELTEISASNTVPFIPKKKNKFAITTVAAAVILFLSFGIFKFITPSVDATILHTPEEIAALSKSISNQSIEEYISIYDEEFAYTDFFNLGDASIIDKAEIINNLSSEVIDEYLEIFN